VDTATTTAEVSAATLPDRIVRASQFVPSLSASAVDQLLRRHERRAVCARLLTAAYLLDLAERRLFRQLGYSSVMHYGTHALGLSPREVWERLRMARALHELPLIEAALRDGRLSWSKAREIIRVAAPETVKAWVARAQRLSCRELEAAVAAEVGPEGGVAARPSRYSSRFVDADTVRVTVDLTPEQFALLDQALDVVRKRLGTEDPADAFEAITRAYLARVGDDVPALRQQIVVHRCRECRTEWRETSKGRIPARASTREPTDLVEVDEPEQEREMDRGSHVESRRSRYVPKDVLRKVRWRETWLYMQRSGHEALPIVSLISFLMGLITAFQAAVQLRQFGADIYVANLVGLSITRELGPLMTAIIASGRSGAAFAAEIGTMKVSEEVDALDAMGLDRTRFLVTPKVIALLVMLPCLTLFADLVGILGGLFVALFSLDIPAVVYFRQLKAYMSMWDIGQGLLKAVVFAILIATIGCLRGFEARAGAESVGRVTTAAIVSGIFAIICADAVFTVLFNVWP